MAPKFGDVRVDGRQLGDLMTSGAPTPSVARVRVQRVVAVATRVGQEVHGPVRALGGDQRSRVPGMPQLTARLPPTLLAATPLTLTSREAVR